MAGKCRSAEAIFLIAILLQALLPTSCSTSSDPRYNPVCLSETPPAQVIARETSLELRPHRYVRSGMKFREIPSDGYEQRFLFTPGCDMRLDRIWFWAKGMCNVSLHYGHAAELLAHGPVFVDGPRKRLYRLPIKRIALPASESDEASSGSDEAASGVGPTFTVSLHFGQQQDGECQLGCYHRNPAISLRLQDIDECRDKTRCVHAQKCVNGLGYYRCYEDSVNATLKNISATSSPPGSQRGSSRLSAASIVLGLLFGVCLAALPAVAYCLRSPKKFREFRVALRRHLLRLLILLQALATGDPATDAAEQVHNSSAQQAKQKAERGRLFRGQGPMTRTSDASANRAHVFNSRRPSTRNATVVFHPPNSVSILSPLSGGLEEKAARQAEEKFNTYVETPSVRASC